LDVSTLTQADADRIRKLLAANNVTISSLAWYTNMTAPDRDAVNASFQKLIDCAVMLGVDVVCTLAGMPVEGKTKLKTIEEDCSQVFPPILQYARSRNVKVALENWFATCLQGLAEFDRMFEVIPDENFGLNFDPSHLLWQGIDYIAAVHRFSGRIFHTHAKDTEVRAERLAYLGNQAGGWWRYVIPGFGQVSWGEYIAALRRAGYDGVLSIEHEDGTFPAEEGFIKGKNYLRTYV
jgi:sugar phosphate isomerase/epimerase